MLKKSSMIVFVLLILVSTANFAQILKTEETLPFSFSHYKLKNGLEVILSEDYTLPLVSVVVAYGVGSVNEQPGKTGLAYLLENLMFQGSLNVSPMQHISLINRVGGKPNASVTEDITLFYETAPSNQLALVFWLESDRMRSLEITPANVENAKAEIIEEILQRKSSEPYLESFFTFDQLLYPVFALSHPVIGNENDIRGLTIEDVSAFYSTYYVPNNAVLCVSGNINKARVKELAEKYFETIPKGKDIPPLPPPPAKPPDKKAIVQTVQDALIPSPAFHLAYRIAPPQSRDSYILTILEYILLKGKSSRLPKRLLVKEPVALHLSGGIEKRNNSSAFKIFAISNNEVMVERCQKAIFSEINKLKSSFVSDSELNKAKNMFKMEYFGRLSTTLDKALFLADAHFSFSNLEDISLQLGKYLTITPLDIIGIINRYFVEENCIILDVKTK